MSNSIINTFSIAAFEAASGGLDSAQASCSLAMDNAIVYSQLGVGMVNIQHYANLRLGATALKHINADMHPQQAQELALGDEGPSSAAYRDQHKKIEDAWTGPKCTDVKHHEFGSNCVAAGNHFVSEANIDAMVETF